MIGSTERQSRIGHIAVAGIAFTILIYAIFYLKAFATYERPAAAQQALDLLSHTSSLYVSTLPTSGASRSDTVNYWNDLSETEARELISWLFLPEQNLGLVPTDEATINDTYIWSVEELVPSKEEALLAIESRNAQRPSRYARVVLFEGNNSEHGMREYKVYDGKVEHFDRYAKPHHQIGPLPIGNETRVEPLTQIYNNRPGTVPFNARYHDKVWEASYAHVLEDLKAEVAEVIVDLFGVTQANFTLHLTVPYSLDGSYARMWFQWSLKGRSSYLMSVPLWTQLDISGRDSSRYHVRKIRYEKQTWRNVSSFKEDWSRGKLNRFQHSIPTDSDWAVPIKANTSQYLPLESKAALVTVSPDGNRYQINSRNNHVTYMGWDFFLSWRRETGLAFWNVNFRDSKVLYEMSLQEASASYSMASDPAGMTSQLLDRYWGLGAASTELIEGYDCPHGSTFLNSNFYLGERSYRAVNNICIFEMDLGRPMSRHNDRATIRSTKGVAMVVRWTATVGNYDYQFDAIFHPSGSIELEVRASGFLLARYWDVEASGTYGSRVGDFTQGVIHDHIMNFKLDFDVDGTENSFVAQRLKSRAERPDWLDDDEEDVVSSYIEQEWLYNEDGGRLDWAANGDATYLIVNNASLNHWGSPRGYRISPGVGSIHRTVSADSPFNRKNSNHAKTHLAVLNRKETEPSSSAAMNQNLGLDPLVDFNLFFDSERLNQTDLVVWANVGTHHIPRAEDAPFTLLTEARAGLLLSPFNFLDSDLSGEFSNSILFYGEPDPKNRGCRKYVQQYRGPDEIGLAQTELHPHSVDGVSLLCEADR